MIYIKLLVSMIIIIIYKVKACIIYIYIYIYLSGYTLGVGVVRAGRGYWVSE